MKRILGLASVCAALAVTGCGGDDEPSESAASEPAAATRADLGAIKQYLLEHTTRLRVDVTALRVNADEYYAVAKSHDFDYAEMLDQERGRVREIIEAAQKGFDDANPAYEEMEGVVAGVPSLADYDVIIDAGGDASDPASAVPFDIETLDGRTIPQPGNFNFLIETSLYGTEPQFAAKGVEPDLDGDGKVEFGEALPDANVYAAIARDFEEQAIKLDEDAQAYEPTLQDAMTALVVMTPTMSEYFEAWKNSRFVAGSKATESAFVSSSRLQDIEDILGGLVLVYDNVQPSIAEADAQQAQQTEASLTDLRDFAGDLKQQEASGKQFTASDADTLGTEAQNQAEAIAGQITQAAGQLNIDLET